MFLRFSVVAILVYGLWLAAAQHEVGPHSTQCIIGRKIIAQIGKFGKQGKFKCTLCINLVNVYTVTCNETNIVN